MFSLWRNHFPIPENTQVAPVFLAAFLQPRQILTQRTCHALCRVWNPIFTHAGRGGSITSLTGSGGSEKIDKQPMLATVSRLGSKAWISKGFGISRFACLEDFIPQSHLTSRITRNPSWWSCGTRCWSLVRQKLRKRRRSQWLGIFRWVFLVESRIGLKFALWKIPPEN